MQNTVIKLLQLSGVLHVEDFSSLLLSPAEKQTFEGFIKSNDEKGLIDWIKSDTLCEEQEKTT